MKHLRAFAASVLVLGVLVMVPAAHATPITYTLSGTFENSSYYSGPADGGSFSGTFTVAGLPLPANSYAVLNSFNIVLKNSLGQVVFTFLSGTPDQDGYISNSDETSMGADYLELYDADGDNFMLLFAKSFTGVGPVVLGSNGYLSDMEFGGTLHTDVNLVASGSARLAIPEPSTVALFGAAFAACSAFLALRRRRHSAALAAAG